MNPQSDYCFRHTTEYTCRGTYTHSQRPIFIHWHIWVTETFGCTICALYFKRLKSKCLLTPNSEHMSWIIGEGVQFEVTPVSQIQKASLYPFTADTDTWSWMYMYRPDENRWTETDAQNPGSFATYTCLKEDKYGKNTSMFHVAPLHGVVNMCPYTTNSSHTSPL